MQRIKRSSSETAGQIFSVFSLVLVVVGACLVARHNIRKGRGDRRGASRIAAAVLVIYMFAWVLAAHHVLTLSEIALIVDATAFFALIAGAVWIFYIALEPYIRRHWPHAMVSWTRILTGRAKDPVVSTHLLIGLLFGVVWSVISAGGALILNKQPGAFSNEISTDALLGFTHVASAFLSVLPSGTISVMVFFFLLFVIRVRVRRERLAAILFVVVFTLFVTLFVSPSWASLPFNLIQFSILGFILTQYGIVPTYVGVCVSHMLITFPLTTDMSAWYAGPAIFAVALVAVAAILAFRGAVAGRPLFREELLD
jgi:hypothetical protein